MTEAPALIGASVARVGLEAKIGGSAAYTADLKRPGMLYGRILRSPHPHARVRSVDATSALAHPGVHAVLTHEDVPATFIDADQLKRLAAATGKSEYGCYLLSLVDEFGI